MSKEIAHALILIFTIVLTFILPKTNLAQYDLRLAPAFLFCFIWQKNLLSLKIFIHA